MWCMALTDSRTWKRLCIKMPIQFYSALLPERSGALFTGRRAWNESSYIQILPPYFLILKTLVVQRVMLCPPIGSLSPYGSPQLPRGRAEKEASLGSCIHFSFLLFFLSMPYTKPRRWKCTQRPWLWLHHLLAKIMKVINFNFSSVSYTHKMLPTNSPSLQCEQEAFSFMLE